jgi:hypothetical protein
MASTGLVLALALAVVAPALPAMADEMDDDAGAEPRGMLDIVSALAAEFADCGADMEQVRALHDAGVGFGEIFKLEAVAAVLGGDIFALLAQLTGEDGELDLGWGAWRHQLTADQLATLERLPRNLGQIVAKFHRPENAGGGNGHGRPAGGGHGQAHGHDKPGHGD